ncbi:hypothetical protein [Andreprevotia sp. IGB-42]|uniref:hypothetical protein n=1 Tax=Andreprevotia sp. IGB-42 TaxID=2497473 RepID=UPI00135A0723|nr:hypothetical protein [Andreprevotia sp. IGB-42]
MLSASNTPFTALARAQLYAATRGLSATYTPVAAAHGYVLMRRDVLDPGTATPERSPAVAVMASAAQEGAASDKMEAFSGAVERTELGDEGAAGYVPNTLRVTGTAANPRMAPYAINADGLFRTPAEALDLARAHGVYIPEDINIGFINKWMRVDADAEYFSQSKHYKPNDWIEWDDFYHPGTGKIPVRVNAALLNSDEALVAHLSHEMYELNSLRDIFEANSGALRAKHLDQLIGPGWAGNLHEQAWDVSDKLIYIMRNGG